MDEQCSFPRLRPSASHAASRQAEIDRVRRMTIEERVKAALGMAQRFAELRPAPRKACPMADPEGVIQAAEEVCGVLAS